MLHREPDAATIYRTLRFVEYVSKIAMSRMAGSDAAAEPMVPRGETVPAGRHLRVCVEYGYRLAYFRVSSAPVAAPAIS